MASSAVSWGSASWAVPGGCSLSGVAPCSLFLEDSLLRSTAAVGLTCCAAHQGPHWPAGFSRVVVQEQACLTVKMHPHPASLFLCHRAGCWRRPFPALLLGRILSPSHPQVSAPQLCQRSHSLARPRVSAAGQAARLRERNWQVSVSGCAHLTLVASLSPPQKDQPCPATSLPMMLLCDFPPPLYPGLSCSLWPSCT